MKVINQLAKKLSIARGITLASFMLLVLVIIIDGLWNGTHLFILAVSLAPLIIFIPSLKSQSHKGLALLCFVILMYFTVTVVNLFAPEPSPFDWVKLLLQVVIFIAAMLFSRWSQYSQYQDIN